MAFAMTIKISKSYSAIFGRLPFIQKQSSVFPSLAVYGFLPMARSFWRSLFYECHDTTVYITGGLSGNAIIPPTQNETVSPSRFELMAVSDAPILGGAEGTDDVVATWLLTIAEHIIESQTLIGLGHTLDFEVPLSSNTEMSAFLFVPASHCDLRRIIKCTNAQTVWNIVPITSAELAFIRQNGVDALISKFAVSGVRPIFDLKRVSVV